MGKRKPLLIRGRGTDVEEKELLEQSDKNKIMLSQTQRRPLSRRMPLTGTQQVLLRLSSNSITFFFFIRDLFMYLKGRTDRKDFHVLVHASNAPTIGAKSGGQNLGSLLLPSWEHKQGVGWKADQSNHCS